MIKNPDRTFKNSALSVVNFLQLGGKDEKRSNPRIHVALIQRGTYLSGCYCYHG